MAAHAKYAPEGAKLIVVDDASEEAYEGADYVFPHNAGIASAKNKCIELLAGCEHIFLFDDDVWPVEKDWQIPYIDSGIKHLSFTFPSLASGKLNGRKLISDKNGIKKYGSPCGCMLYIHREIIDRIGGFDVDYPQWGLEHVDFSMRAYNAGLIPHPFLDISHSLSLFESLDQKQEITGSVSSQTKREVLAQNRKRFKENTKSSERMNYKTSGDGILLASYFNSVADPQRKIKWGASPGDLMALATSCRKHGVKFKIFHDCLPIDTDEFPWVKGPRDQAPNVYRWEIYRDYLEKNPAPFVFMVDSTDVEVLRNPFISMNPGRLYSGDEQEKTDNIWMRRNQQPHLASLRDYRSFISHHHNSPLLNCGIVGGSQDLVMEYLGHRVEIHREHTRGVLASTDMAVHNYIARKYFKGRISHGIKVNTRFKQYEYNTVSFFKHK